MTFGEMQSFIMFVVVLGLEINLVRLKQVLPIKGKG